MRSHMCQSMGVFRASLLLIVLACSMHACECALKLPLMGWSTWNTFKEDISDELIRSSAEVVAHGPLFAAGYNYILIDDGWSVCSKPNPDGSCAVAGPRDSSGRLVPDPKKFPNGFGNLTHYVHSLGLKIGIYTSPSSHTCGGFQGSLHHEQEDAETFVTWGFDFVKYDTCGTDCPIHDGCIQNSTILMSTELRQYNPSIVLYLDSGNPTSPQRVYNPHNYHVSNQEALAKVAIKPSELVWIWADGYVDFFKSWFDMEDTWLNTLTNAHNQIRTAMYQHCGFFNTPDMLTIGMGAMTATEYKSQMLLWSILGAPLVLGADIRHLQQEYVDLVTAPEVLAVAQDPDCTQGSLVRSLGAGEVWIRPLSGGEFAVLLLNKGQDTESVELIITNDVNWGDFYPAQFTSVRLRDVLNRTDLGVFSTTFVAKLASHDSILLRVTPL